MRTMRPAPHADAAHAVRELTHDEGHFTGSNGTTLYWQRWRARPSARGVLVNLHGLGDHSGLYPHVAVRFAPLGFSVCAYDQRGNGRSPGQRAFIGTWAELRDDLDAFVRQVRTWHPGLPVFVMGHSLGALVALDHAIHHPTDLRGVIAVSPPLGALGVPAPLLLLARLLSRVWPRFSLETGMDLGGLARDPAVAEAVLADPLFHRRGTARLATELAAAIARVQRCAAELRAPVLLLHGGGDRMVPPEGTRAFFTRLAAADRRLLEYPDAYHALLADLGGAEAMDDVAAWLEARL